MISIGEYTIAEAAAIKLFPNLYADNKWGIVPETQAHLVWVKELKDLQVLLNRFQCDRFRSYVYELGGLSAEDLDKFIRAKDILLGMQRCYYPEIKPVVPVETMLSSLTIYRKIKAARSNAKTILEIGPGAGLNSLFFSQDSQISNYTQIEAQPATYLSQAMVNEQCYGNSTLEITASPIVDENSTYRLWHVPWWSVGELYATSITYDVVTANACLNEIQDSMVDRYLDLIEAKTHSDTLMLLQDLGEWMIRSDVELQERLRTRGWYLNFQTRNWEIEAAIKPSIHGDAVTTWWLSRHELGNVGQLIKRREQGVLVNSDYRGFTVNGEIWDRDALAKIQ